MTRPSRHYPGEMHSFLTQIQQKPRRPGWEVGLGGDGSQVAAAQLSFRDL